MFLFHVFFLAAFRSFTHSIPLRTYKQFATINVNGVHSVLKAVRWRCLQSISMSINAAAAAGDVVITVSLCYLLQRSRTGFRRWIFISAQLLAVHSEYNVGRSDWTINKLVSHQTISRSRFRWKTSVAQIMFSINTGLLTRSALWLIEAHIADTVTVSVPSVHSFV